MTSDSKSWPLLDERAPFATASQARRRGKTPRSPWVLMALAFLCGGLVSAAAFAIGWRHQAQRNTAAQSALATAHARARRLERTISTLQTTLSEARGTATTAHAAAVALARTGANVATDVTSSERNGTAVAAGAGALTASASRLANELKTLDTYLTTTPAGQLDPGYISSQGAYLAKQISRLQEGAGTLGSSVATLESALRRLGSDASGLKTH